MFTLNHDLSPKHNNEESLGLRLTAKLSAGKPNKVLEWVACVEAASRHHDATHDKAWMKLYGKLFISLQHNSYPFGLKI